jgi:hypothetical protein
VWKVILEEILTILMVGDDVGCRGIAVFVGVLDIVVEGPSAEVRRVEEYLAEVWKRGGERGRVAEGREGSA